MSNDHIIAAQICVQARFALFLWGAPGIGKTAVLEELAPMLDEKIWTVLLSIREPSDQGGLPIIRPNGVTMHPPLWAHELNQEQKGIVFWDEFNTAPATTQSSALRIIHGGYAGDMKLPRETSHVAAGNPPEEFPGGFNLTAAIANRWVHIRWPLQPAIWCSGMVSGWESPPVVQVPADWRRKVPVNRGLIAAFISQHPELLLSYPTSRVEQGRAWPSPRTWERVAFLIAACDAAGYHVKSEVTRLLVLGCVGEGATITFYTWLNEQDLRDPEEYLAEPYKTPLPDRQDKVMSTLMSVCAAALSKSHADAERAGRWVTAWKVIGRVMDSAPDLAIPAARILATVITTDPALKSVKTNLPPELSKILPFLEEAKIDHKKSR